MQKKGSSYIVTIRREGDEWVARDAGGNRRAWAEARDGVLLVGRGLAGHLFQSAEIGSVVTLTDGSVQVEVLTD